MQWYWSAVKLQYFRRAKVSTMLSAILSFFQAMLFHKICFQMYVKTTLKGILTLVQHLCIIHTDSGIFVTDYRFRSQITKFASHCLHLGIGWHWRNLLENLEPKISNLQYKINVHNNFFIVPQLLLIKSKFN